MAFEAQRAAERSKKDVLLVDTAGAGMPSSFPREGVACRAWVLPQARSSMHACRLITVRVYISIIPVY